jgi:SAM-dependent methyltransferase
MNSDSQIGAHRFSYDRFARTCAPDDFLGQVKRTVHGVPLGEDQLTMIVSQIRRLLDLTPDDRLLDIACGNGHLSQHLFSDLGGYLGSDVSEYLIDVASRNFAHAPDFTFVQRDTLDHLREEACPGKFTKMLCYGSVQYFSDEQLADVLHLARRRFPALRRFLIGNCPNRDRAADFFQRTYAEADLDDIGTALGRWRTSASLRAIAEDAGWDIAFSLMPPSFSGAAYRFDALLTPGTNGSGN